MKIQAVKYMLMAQNMNRAVTFYRDVIGLTQRFISDEWSELTFGDAIVALHGGGDGSINPTGLSIQVEDVDQACADIQAAGCAIITQPSNRPGEPIILAEFQDQEGNQVMITQYVG
ncbi:MAG: VOC family protein [Cyanobacteria bacterium P01_C01_bin.121]